MPKRQLTTIGLLVYATILVTSFLHVLEAFLAYSHPVTLGPLTVPGWVSGVGVALGLDLSILYFSYLSVILPGPGALTAKQASRAAMLLVWFAVLYSMVWEHVAAGRWLEAGVGVLLSLFVPLTSLRVGQLLAEIARVPGEALSLTEAAKAVHPGDDPLSGRHTAVHPGDDPLSGRAASVHQGAAQLVRVETHIHTAQDSLKERTDDPRWDGRLRPPFTGVDDERKEAPTLSNPTERAVMRVLQERGYVQLAELMQYLGTSLNQIGEVCGALEARGLIRRRDGGWEAT
jgi:hypothetical protein